MIPVLSSEQLRQADAHTIAHTPIAPIDLMERAALACSAWINAHTGRPRPVLVLAGTGNNGGDGLAIARLLHAEGRSVRAVVFRHGGKESPSFAENMHRAEMAGVKLEYVAEDGALPGMVADEIMVDALLGIGLSRPVQGRLKEAVTLINALPNEVVSIDMPSGLFPGGNAGNDPEAIIRATHTLTLELPKLALFLADNAPFAGEWHVLPIGLDRAFISTLKAEAALIEAADMAAMLPPRQRFAHKGDFGHAWLLAGGPGKMGAAILAAKACLRSGSGLLTVHVPAGQAGVLHASVPEAMVSMDEDPRLSILPGFKKATAIGIGPGMGTADATARLLKLLIQQAPAPLVLDADALNILSENKNWLAFLPAGTILTPHPKELERLVGKAESSHARLMKARELAVRNKLVVVLKGAYTAICALDGRIFFNNTGNPGMAKGGSGDALTGIITGLRAQGLDPLSAALLGVHAHGLAGNIAAEELGMDGMLPSDLIERLPMVWKVLRKSSGAGSTA